MLSNFFPYPRASCDKLTTLLNQEDKGTCVALMHQQFFTSACPVALNQQRYTWSTIIHLKVFVKLSFTLSDGESLYANLPGLTAEPVILQHQQFTVIVIHLVCLSYQ